MMTVVLGGMCSHRPPCIAVSIRAATYTHGSINDKKAFTVNVPSLDFMRETDFVGLVSGRDTDKFAATGLTAVKGESVDAPYIEEFPTAAECELRHSLDLGSHTMFIGEIMKIHGQERLLVDLGENYRNIPDMMKAKGFVYVITGDGRYYCGLGEALEKSYTIGRALMPEKQEE